MSPVQCTERYFRKGASCALGAMVLGLGFEPHKSVSPEDDADDFVPNAVCRAYQNRYGSTIPDDNDYHGFTREQIAARIAAL